MRIYKSFFRFEKCRKACKYRLYRLMRTYKEIVKNYILIYVKSLYIISLFIYNVNLFYYEVYYVARQKQPDNQINYLNYPAIFPASFLTFTSAFV